jgi:hypothetical protein
MEHTKESEVIKVKFEEIMINMDKVKYIVDEVVENVVNEINNKALEFLFNVKSGEIEPSEREWNCWLITNDGAKFVDGGYLEYIKMKVMLMLLIRVKLLDELNFLRGKMEQLRDRWERSKQQ